MSALGASKAAAREGSSCPWCCSCPMWGCSPTVWGGWPGWGETCAVLTFSCHTQGISPGWALEITPGLQDPAEFLGLSSLKSLCTCNRGSSWKAARKWEWTGCSVHYPMSRTKVESLMMMKIMTERAGIGPGPGPGWHFWPSLLHSILSKAFQWKEFLHSHFTGGDWRVKGVKEPPQGSQWEVAGWNSNQVCEMPLLSWPYCPGDPEKGFQDSVAQRAALGMVVLPFGQGFHPHGGLFSRVPTWLLPALFWSLFLVLSPRGAPWCFI